jgi:uncharacterized protein (TIGR02466 family)
MKNTFAENIVDFLKLYDPFKTVAYSDLLDIASQSEIIYLEKSKRLFKINDELHQNFYIVNSWANVHTPGDWAQSHKHVNSLISGCYYLKTPAESGQIRFLKNAGHTNLFPLSTAFDYNDVNHVTSESWGITPKEGMILLFPSHLLHEVDKNNSKENRYSLAFNLYAKGSFGYDECYLELN